MPEREHHTENERARAVLSNWTRVEYEPIPNPPRERVLYVENHDSECFGFLVEIPGSPFTRYRMMVSRESFYYSTLRDMMVHISRELSGAIGVNERCIYDSLEQLAVRASPGIDWTFRTGVRVPIREERPSLVGSRIVEGRGQARCVVDYDESSRTVRVSPDWGREPDAGSSFILDPNGANRTITLPNLPPSDFRWTVGGMFSSLFESQDPQADERAKKLLLEHLTDEQRKEFSKCGIFPCVGSASKDIYKIHDYRQGNVYRQMKDGTQQHLCLVQKDDVPLYDQLLTQKLLIENNEPMFLERANNLSTFAFPAFAQWANRMRIATDEVSVAVDNASEAMQNASSAMIQFNYRYGVGNPYVTLSINPEA